MAANPPPSKEVTRGKISEWSPKSRMALKCHLARLRRDALGSACFVTLTYPAAFPAPEDHATYKNHLRVMGQAMRREFGDRFSAIWKLEFQRRGAAHFHLIAFGMEGRELPDVRAWCAARWAGIVGSGDERHLRAGTQVDKARSIAGAMSYLCKYIAKEDQTMPGNFTGRYWGKVHAEALPFAESEQLELRSDREANCLARIMRKIIAHQVNASRWKRALDVPGHSMQSAAGWTRAAAEYRLSGARCVFVPFRAKSVEVDGERVGVEGGRIESWSYAFAPDPFFKPPRKYKPRCNATVRLIVDAAPFVAAFLRGRERGLWDEPAPF